MIKPGPPGYMSGLALEGICQGTQSESESKYAHNLEPRAIPRLGCGNTQLTRWCNDPGHELGYWGYLRLRYTQVDLVIIGLFHRGMTSSPNLIHHCSQRKWQLMTISTTSGNNYSSSTGNKVHSIKLEFCLANYAVDGFDDRNALQQAKKVSESSSQNFHVIALLTFGFNKLRTRAPWTALADAFWCCNANAQVRSLNTHQSIWVWYDNSVPSNLMVNQHFPW